MKFKPKPLVARVHSFLASHDFLNYVAAVAATLFIFLVRLALAPVFQEHASLHSFLIAVALSAWMGGTRPAIASALLGLYLGHFFLGADSNSSVLFNARNIG